MRLLYVASHPVLAYEEISLFSEMGLLVYRKDVAPDASGQGENLRPALAPLKDPLLADMARREAREPLPLGEWVKPFDAILSTSVEWLLENWKSICRQRVIWRSFGRSSRFIEEKLRPLRAEGLQIVRYSPKEATIDGYSGEDTLIRCHKDPETYQGWSGQKETIVNFTRSMKYRGRECNFAFLKQVVEGLPFQLFGPQNDNFGEEWASGLLSFGQMLDELRASRVYFYTGRYPAAYTLGFAEAWITGIPMVAIGPERGNDPHLPGHSHYEIPDLVCHGVDGFYSDDETELRQILRDLLSDRNYAAAVGARGRQKAIELFGKEKIKRRWSEFLFP